MIKKNFIYFFIEKLKYNIIMRNTYKTFACDFRENSINFLYTHLIQKLSWCH